MKKLRVIILILLIQLKGFASSEGLLSQVSQLISSGLGYNSDETVERVSFPGNIKLLIKKTNSGYEFSTSTAAQEAQSHLLTVDKLDTIALFSNQNPGLTSVARIDIKDSASKDVHPATTWFALESGNSLIVLIKKDKDFKVFRMPFNEGHSLGDISVSPIRMNDRYYYLISLKNKNNNGRTYLLDPPSSTVSIVQEKFHKLTELENNFPKPNYKFDSQSNKIQFSHEPEISLNEVSAKKYSIDEITAQKQTQGQPQAQEKRQVSPQQPKESSPISISEVSTPKSNLNGEKPVSSSGFSKPDFQKEFEYNGEIYKVYSTQLVPKGTFISRKSDNTIVMISTQSAPSNSNSDFGGFNFKDGILSHPNLLRAVDLGLPGSTEDIFKIESTYHPELENKEAVTWVLDSFQDFKIQSENEMDPIQRRNEVVDGVKEVLFSGETTSQILVGEGSDKDLVLSSITKKLPRTWKAVEFDTGSIGDISMSGYLEEKTKKISDAIKSIPMVLIAKDFPNFSGFGVTQGSTRDILQLLRKDFTSSRGHLKLIGTAYDTDQVVEKIKDPSISNNLQMVPVNELTTSEIKEHLRKYFSLRYNAEQSGIVLSDTFLDYMINKAAQIKRIDPEPKRSEDFLASIVRTLKKKKTFSSESFTTHEVDSAVTYHFKIDKLLATEKGQNEILSNLIPEIGKKIIGHGHITQDVLMGSGIGLSGLHSNRGPMQTHWLEGPPGVGKTELATAMASSLKVPLSYIEMNQFKRGSGNTSSELLSQIAMALKKNPYSVILLDEVEKADPKVLEGLLAILSNDKFSYYEDQGNGQRKAKHESAVNATFVFTSNGIGELVLNWYYERITADEKYDNLSSEQLNKEFLELHSKEKLIEMLVTPGANPQLPEGLPRPLIDRIKYFHVAFPPGFDATVSLLKLKLAEIKKQTTSSMDIKFKLGSDNKSEEEIIKTFVTKAKQERKSVRNTIDEFDKAVKGTLFLLRLKNSDYKKDKYYSVNPIGNTTLPIKNKCYIEYAF